MSALFHPTGCPTASRHHTQPPQSCLPPTSTQAHLENLTRDWVLLFQACARSLAPIVLPLCIAHYPAACSLLKLMLSPWTCLHYSALQFPANLKTRGLECFSVSLSRLDLRQAFELLLDVLTPARNVQLPPEHWKGASTPLFKEVSSQLLPRKHPSHISNLRWSTEIVEVRVSVVWLLKGLHHSTPYHNCQVAAGLNSSANWSPSPSSPVDQRTACRPAVGPVGRWADGRPRPCPRATGYQIRSPMVSPQWHQQPSLPRIPRHLGQLISGHQLSQQSLRKDPATSHRDDPSLGKWDENGQRELQL